MWKLFQPMENHLHQQKLASFLKIIPEDINKWSKIWMNIENLKRRFEEKLNEQESYFKKIDSMNKENTKCFEWYLSFV
jgi:hypothetical protein